jgi:hypothetical protein
MGLSDGHIRGHAEHPAGAGDVGEGGYAAAWVPSSHPRLREARTGAPGCDRQVVHYSTNLRTTPYELRMRTCGHRAITRDGRHCGGSCAVMGHKQQASTRGNRRARPRHAPSSTRPSSEATRALEALQPGGADHEAIHPANPDGGQVLRPAEVTLTSAAVAASGAHFFNVSGSVNDSGALIVS